jgi:hypothetical protein
MADLLKNAKQAHINNRGDLNSPITPPSPEGRSYAYDQRELPRQL